MKDLRCKKRGGFAAMMAVVVLGLVGVALGAMAVAFAGEARRSGTVGSEAQLRQMLIAGVEDARAGLGTGAAAERAVALPKELVEQGGKLVLKQVASGEREAKFAVETRLNQNVMTQEIKFAKEGEGWRLASARLGE